MASNTPNLGLLKKDPATDGNDTFNVKTMLNDNWDKIDEAVGNIQVPEASLTQKGIVQLSSSVSDTSEDKASTSKATKMAYDKAVEALNKANDAKSTADAAEKVDGAQAKADAALAASNLYVDNKTWQKSLLTNDDGTSRLISNKDLNTVTKTGFYCGENLTNAPTTNAGKWWYIEVQCMSTNTWVIQIARDLLSTTGNSYLQRTMTNGTWGTWSQDLFTSVASGKAAVKNAIEGRYGETLLPAYGGDWAFFELENAINQKLSRQMTPYSLGDNSGIYMADPGYYNNGERPFFVSPATRVAPKFIHMAGGLINSLCGYLYADVLDATSGNSTGTLFLRITDSKGNYSEVYAASMYLSKGYSTWIDIASLTIDTQTKTGLVTATNSYSTTPVKGALGSQLPRRFVLPTTFDTSGTITLSVAWSVNNTNGNSSFSIRFGHVMSYNRMMYGY
ncbi:pyocin knob domain-containing protein [Paenibacillus dokdonensis]|uniref:Pyocin knob domain-containing protein n=1 Tax=Paenibacillus dokdonensis TaxID=2567944 RepID=A0ABU6GKJ9_9BACL|nr:pyocin knob domain-containing protein [Paenibacillus dokdonensis]MEC0239245.1 pyocin knob domain-containing protein [Paenibacillus dokdonensis]